MKKINQHRLEKIAGGHQCSPGTTHEISLIRTFVFVLRFIPGTGDVFEVSHPGRAIPQHLCI